MDVMQYTNVTIVNNKPMMALCDIYANHSKLNSTHCLPMFSMLKAYFLCNKRVTQGSERWSLFVSEEIKAANGCT